MKCTRDEMHTFPSVEFEMKMWVFVHSFSKYVLGVYSVKNVVLGSRDIKLNKTVLFFQSRDIRIMLRGWRRRWIIR